MDMIRSLFIAFVVLFSGLLHAGQISNLYQTSISVPLQSVEPTQQQVISGLKQVLIKVAGNRDIQSNPQLVRQLSTAPAMLQQFNYQLVSGQEGLAETDKTQLLVMNFNQSEVDALIKSTGIKPLGPQRPTLLVWLASDRDGVQDYVSSEDALYRTFESAADRRAVSIQFPLLDLEDLQALPVTDFWGFFAESIDKASMRYRADAVLLGRVQTQPGTLNSVEWFLVENDGSQRFASSGSVEKAINDVFDMTADRLLSRIVSHDLSYFQEGVAVQVSGVNDLSDYLQMTEFLESLAVVQQVLPERVQQERITVRLQLDGSSQQLKQAIALDPRMVAQDHSVKADGTDLLSYRWQD